MFQWLTRYFSGAPAPQPRLPLPRLFRAVVERDDWVVLDLETTGVTKASELIEIAVVSADSTVLLNEYVMPKGRIPKEASDVHGITRDMLKGCATWTEWEPYVYEMLRDKLVITYNAEFDMRMLRQSSEKWGLEPFEYRTACAMLAYAQHRRIPHPRRKGEFKWFKLQKACLEEGVEWLPNHRALSDAIATRELLLTVAGRNLPT